MKSNSKRMGGSMINKNGGQTILFKLLSRERKADFESGLSSVLIIEEIEHSIK